MKKILVTSIMLFFIPVLAFPQGIKGKMQLGVQAGYWSPNFDKFNDSISSLVQSIEDLGANVTGDQKVGSAVDYGASFTYGIISRLGLRLEAFYWSKENTLTATESGQSAELTYKVHLTPILISALYYFSNNPGKVIIYGGAGAGAFSVKTEVASELFGVNNDSESKGNDFLFQGLLGIEYPFSSHIGLFAEGRYMFGKFSMEDETTKENVSIAGPQVMFGARFQLGG